MANVLFCVSATDRNGCAASETTSDSGTTPSDDGYSKPAGYLDVDFGGRTFTFITTSDWSDGMGGFLW